MKRILFFQILPLRIICCLILGAGAILSPVFRNDCFGQTPVSDLERNIFINSGNLGYVTLGDSTISAIRIVNRTTAILTIVSIQCPTLAEHTQFPNAQGLQVQAMQGTTAIVVFRPQSLIPPNSIHSIVVTVRLPSGELQSATFANVLYVEGAIALKLITPPQQVASIDSIEITHATLINRWREPIRIDSVYFRTNSFTDTNAFRSAFPRPDFLPRTLLPNDTLRLPISIQPKHVGVLSGNIFVLF